jgi:CDP-glucose 4,6-dehydratase
MKAAGSWQGRRVLVTGHTGFKGAWLCAWLLDVGATVTGVALAPETSPNLYELLGLERGMDSRLRDIRDLEAMKGVLREARPEVVIHMAAQALVRRSYQDPVQTYATNLMGTVNVLEAARAVDSVRAVVNVTSDKCYENLETQHAYRETDAMGGHDPYSSSKGAAELITSAYRRSFFAREGKLLASARAGNVIGGGDWSEDRLIPDCVRAFAAGRDLVVRNPLAVRPWQHVLEPLAGYLLLAQRLAAGDAAAADAWNFGPGESDAAPVERVVNEAVRLWGGKARWKRDETVQPHEAHLLRLDASKARRELGWRPRLGLDETLRWTIDWYRAQAGGADARGLVAAQLGQYRALQEKAAA